MYSASPAIAASSILLLLALLHSGLGERFLITPLLEAPTWPEGALGRRFGGRTLRAAWHLTSVALAALGLVLLVPESSATIVYLTCLVAALVMGLCTRGAHLSWPLFGLAGLGLVVPWVDTPPVKSAVGVAVALVLAALAALHIYWARGGRWGLRSVIPQLDDERPLFVPSPLATLGVAALLLLGATLVLAASGLVPNPLGVWTGRLALAMAAVFMARAIGDFRYCGIFKRKLNGAFAAADTQLFVPLCWLISVGTAVTAS